MTPSCARPCSLSRTPRSGATQRRTAPSIQVGIMSDPENPYPTTSPTPTPTPNPNPNPNPKQVAVTSGT